MENAILKLIEEIQNEKYLTFYEIWLKMFGTEVDSLGIIYRNLLLTCWKIKVYIEG